MKKRDNLKIQNDILRAEIRDLENQIKDLQNEINYDRLTGLFSRKKLDEDLYFLLENKKPCTICFFDINDLKETNDTYGHGAGDALLKAFSKEILKLYNYGIKGYREGGDEFVAIIENAKVDSCIQKILKIRGKDVILSSKDSTQISFAIGIIENDFVATPRELLKEADRRMYQNKEKMRAVEI